MKNLYKYKFQILFILILIILILTFLKEINSINSKYFILPRDDEAAFRVSMNLPLTGFIPTLYNKSHGYFPSPMP